MQSAERILPFEPPVDGKVRRESCLARDVLDRVGDKWSVFVIAMLGDRPRRFTELLRTIDGISQRMLTVTLRGLERDGLVSRKVHAVVPPRVDYALTPTGRTLLATLRELMIWADRHTAEIAESRVAYDARLSQPPPD
jgi:DNA-binding HxlR family transcriptional regulator